MSNRHRSLKNPVVEVAPFPSYPSPPNMYICAFDSTVHEDTYVLAPGVVVLDSTFGVLYIPGLNALALDPAIHPQYSDFCVNGDTISYASA